MNGQARKVVAMSVPDGWQVCAWFVPGSCDAQMILRERATYYALQLRSCGGDKSVTLSKPHQLNSILKLPVAQPGSDGGLQMHQD